MQLSEIKNKKIYLVSLGCSKNLVDGEFMSSKLSDYGFTITNDASEAQIAIVNTCGFIDSAKEESIGVILDMAKLKDEANLELLIASGCLSERYADDMQVSLPEVDAILGVRNYKDIVLAIQNYYEDTSKDKSEDAFLSRIYKSSNKKEALSHLHSQHIPSTKHYAYLKIAEGCSNHCSFCAIPGIRGPFQSRPMEDIIQEAKFLVSQCYDEIIVIAQDTGFYGLDLYKERKLVALLEALSQIKEIKWIKVLYLYAEGLSKELVSLFKNKNNLIPYFDIPIQHASDKILKSMNRKDSSKVLEEKINYIRQEIPQAVIRTTVMVGYPGETQEDFNQLLRFIERIRFDRLGGFMYSPEEGTKAYQLEDKIDSDTMHNRFEVLMEVQRKISREILESKIGTNVEVKIDSISDDGIYYLARSAYEIPEVDPLIYVLNQSEKDIIEGNFYNVKLIEAEDYDLIGVIEE